MSFPLFTSSSLIFNILVSNAIENGGAYVSKADIRKAKRRMRNGSGRNQCVGGRVENSKGFYPDSFDRVLLDAPCSALGLRPRLFTGEVRESKLQLICPFVFYNIFLF